MCTVAKTIELVEYQSIYVNNKLIDSSKNVTSITKYSIEKVMEYAGMEIQVPKRTLILGVYRIPSLVI